MNKKFATLLFAIGLGVASSPAMASCAYYCNRAYNACMNNGVTPADDCAAQEDACMTAC